VPRTCHCSQRWKLFVQPRVYATAIFEQTRCLIFLTVYAMAQLSKAVIPKDAGGPFAQRIGVTVGGSQGWALRVGAYVTRRTSSSDWLRYSVVVLNCESLMIFLEFTLYIHRYLRE